MTAITLSFDKDGKGALVHGPEVPFKVQQKFMQKAKHSFPKLEGVVRLEMWSGANGRRKKAVKPKTEAEKIADEKAYILEALKEMKEKELFKGKLPAKKASIKAFRKTLCEAKGEKYIDPEEEAEKAEKADEGKDKK